MPAYGRSIQIYLADGTPSGVRHVEIANWSGQAIACPRSRFAELAKWDEAKRPGVYFLIERQFNDSESRAYIGESENVVKRLNDHERNKDFWNEVVIFTSKDENLTKSHIKYLESRLVAIGTTCARYQLENSNKPTESTLPRAHKDAMEEFIENLKVIMGTLGHKLLDPMKTSVDQTMNSTKTTIGIPFKFSLKDLNATGQITDDGFLLLAGSDVSTSLSSNLSNNFQAFRDSLIEDGTLISDGQHFKLSKDVLFSSSSYAAAMVAGTNRSGPQSWIDPQGRTLKAIEELMLNGSEN